MRSIVDSREEDALIEIRCWTWNRQGSQQPEHPRATADLGRAGRAALDMGGQTRRIGCDQVIEEEEIDELPGACAIQGGADGRGRHITYMT